MKSNPKKVVVGMSGGVDSSVAALILKNKGYEVIGVTMKLSKQSTCCDVEDISHAKEACRVIGIKHYTMNLVDEFEKEVIGYFVNELESGRTPNPCVHCNRFLKFDQLFKFAKEHKADFVATGHYARIRKGKSDGVSGDFELVKGLDETKDQTYYLSILPQKWLGKILFPLGGMKKVDVKKLADSDGLSFLARKKESQDLCFVSDKYRKYFISQKIPHKPGNIVDEKGNVLGAHLGVHFYTIGQRKGIEVPNGPYFVVGINPSKNEVCVSKNSKSDGMFGDVVHLRKVNFVSGVKPQSDIEVMAKIRYQQELGRAVLSFSGSQYSLKFKTPQRAITKGQVAVFYKGQACLGGGFIK